MPQLILTADPDFADLALRELMKFDSSALVVQPLEMGVFLIELESSFWTVAEAWRKAPPIFVSHICPVLATVSLADTREDLDALRLALTLEIIPLIDPTIPFSIQARTLCDLSYKRFDINNTLADAIKGDTGTELDVRKPEQIVSVVCATRRDSLDEDKSEQKVAFMGVSLTVHNLSDWAGGMRRYAREEGRVSRSEFKLLEALEVFEIVLPQRGVALDLGAAPGGWTRVLRQRNQYVTAVDPGQLDKRLVDDRAIRHKRMTAEEYLEQDPDQFDVIVNDMRIDARDSARLMVSYAENLYRHGIAIVTLKLPEYDRQSIVEHALKILNTGYKVAGVRHLFHNRSEITVYLQHKKKVNSKQ